MTLKPGEVVKEPFGSWVIEFYSNDNKVRARAIPVVDGVELVRSPRIVELV